MAHKRMFSRDVIGTEWFTDMPATAQMLYVHLSMDADDDGFIVNIKTAMINSHASKDDLLILLSKRYIIQVEDGLYLVKHWRQNNYIQKDRKKRSDYADRLVNFGIKEDGSYTLKSESDKCGEIIDMAPQKKPLEGARLARYEARKNSDLPYCFDYKIRRAFNGKRCPICGVTMIQAKDYSSPTIQHNVPISMGGRHEITNISVICRHCNTSIQNHQTTGPLNNDEVQRVWNEIGNVSGMDTENSIEESRLEEVSIVENNQEIIEGSLEERGPGETSGAYAYTREEIESSDLVAEECLTMKARRESGVRLPPEWENTLNDFGGIIQKYEDDKPW